MNGPINEHKREHRVPGLSEPVSHYTDVVTAGGFAFISGMVALDDAGRVVGDGDATAQARQALKNLGLCLAAVGAMPSDVCKVTVYLRNIDRYRVMTNPTMRLVAALPTMVEARSTMHRALLPTPSLVRASKAFRG